MSKRKNRRRKQKIAIKTGLPSNILGSTARTNTMTHFTTPPKSPMNLNTVGPKTAAPQVYKPLGPVKYTVIRPTWLDTPMTQQARDGGPMKMLLEMLTFGRPDNSDHEYKFIERFIEPVPNIDADEFGNYMVRVPREDGAQSKVMWSCHTDTVHRKGRMQIVALGDDDIIRLSPNSTSNCLGADDTAGCWMMLRMIKFGVPGLYVFHRGEEIGGQGSDFISRKRPEVVDGIKACIAFDRAGYESVITHQMYRTCSDTFAASMNDMLSLPYKGDTGGTFTDSANYTDLVPECTNLSVGYHRQHTSSECLDARYLTLLAKDIIRNFDEDKMVIEREPASVDYDDGLDYLYGGGYGYGSPPSSSIKREKTFDDVAHLWPLTIESMLGNTDIAGGSEVSYDATMTLTGMVKAYPDVAAEMLTNLGIDEYDLAELIYSLTGKLP